jgi:hypothetical protein
MVSSSFALALASLFLPPFRISGVPHRGHLHLLDICFSLLFYDLQIFKLEADEKVCVHFPLVKLKVATPITIMTPPTSWLAVGIKANMAKEKIAVKNGSIVRMVAVLDTA